MWLTELYASSSRAEHTRHVMCVCVYILSDYFSSFDRPQTCKLQAAMVPSGKNKLSAAVLLIVIVVAGMYVRVYMYELLLF